MASTNFIDGTVIEADWLNDVNYFVYNTTPLVTADIGVSVQAFSANLSEYAAVNPTAAGLALLDDADASAQRATLGLVIGTDVQAYDVNTVKYGALQAQTGIAYTTGGSSTAYTLTPSPAIGSLVENQEFDVEFHTAAGASPTLAISGLTAKNLKYRDSTGASTTPTSTQIPAGWRSKVTYDGTDYLVREIPTSSSSSSGITLGTPVASTSGTSIDFTGLPAGLKRITVMYAGVSTNGTSNWLVQIGAGSFTTTGYVGQANSGAGVSANSAGYNVNNNIVAANVHQGIVTLTLLGSNTWAQSGLVGCQTTSNSMSTSCGYLALGGTLDRVRLTMVNGTDTFDAGTVNISYE